jgi:7-cyano-7-deazaguanine synthase
MMTQTCTTKPPKAVALLSGGLDSTTVLALAKAQGFLVFALSFDYGQSHKAELRAASRVARTLGVQQHTTLKIDLAGFGGSALLGDGTIPKQRSAAEMSNGVPVTYVPARNTVFLSLALAWAESLQATNIFIGVNALDYSGYPDCRPEFIRAFEMMANLGTKIGSEGATIKVQAPLISMTKSEIIRTGLQLGIDYGDTVTCYDASDDGVACGSCDACILRLKGFAQNSIPDPAPYRKLD